MKTIDQRITILEKKSGYVKGRVPGTQIVRTLTPEGIEWSLSLGLMQDRKQFFVAPTIEGCIINAEKGILTFSVKKNKNKTMKNMPEHFGEGDCVNVKYLPGEMYPRDFTGYVVEVGEEYVLVLDEDGKQWECEPELLRHSSDEIMHRNL